jgi:hypothetical protein
MAVIITRQPFSKAERDMVVEAVITGRVPQELPELEDISLTIAEQLPDLLVKARLSDTSENRRKVVDLVLVRWAAPKHRPSRSYRQFRNG